MSDALTIAERATLLASELLADIFDWQRAAAASPAASWAATLWRLRQELNARLDAHGPLYYALTPPLALHQRHEVQAPEAGVHVSGEGCDLQLVAGESVILVSRRSDSGALVWQVSEVLGRSMTIRLAGARTTRETT